MSDNTDNYTRFDHDQFARSKGSDDFWGQIRRTVNGKPVSEEQIEMIVGAINSSLKLKPNDVLLDLACGNGALSQQLFEHCTQYLGVDLSPFLISVAKENFEKLPNYEFLQADVGNYILNEMHPERYTKVLCYGSFSYFPEEVARETLKLLFNNFVNVERVYIGNLPDRDRSELFYTTNAPSKNELLDHSSQIGIWRTVDEFVSMAAEVGWNAVVQKMPEGFYSSRYRYDILLSR